MIWCTAYPVHKLTSRHLHSTRSALAKYLDEKWNFNVSGIALNMKCDVQVFLFVVFVPRVTNYVGQTVAYLAKKFRGCYGTGSLLRYSQESATVPYSE